jgi:flagellar hook assembly protein FlgD
LSNVRISIFDRLGRHVKTLTNQKVQSGSYEIFWDGSDNNYNQVAAGIYFCRMESSDFLEVIKLVLIK